MKMRCEGNTNFIKRTFNMRMVCYKASGLVWFPFNCILMYCRCDGDLWANAGLIQYVLYSIYRRTSTVVLTEVLALKLKQICIVYKMYCEGERELGKLQVLPHWTRLLYTMPKYNCPSP